MASNSPLAAQIVPDATLPTNSIVTPNGNTFTIDGGTAAGGNLFHSFREFSVSTGNTAFFNNASTVENIITRVTGGQISNIDGLIRANGKANLFLINPSGLIFGPNAKLDIGGSFIGSTGDSIRFTDGNVFNATNPNAPPLLTVNVPIGLQYGSNPGDIRVQGGGHDLIQPQLSPFIIGQIKGLQVQNGQTLALVGGNVILEGGVLTAESGQIELGGVADGEVSLSSTVTGWTLGYDSIKNFRDIRLLSLSAADTSGAPGGSIRVSGRNLEMRDGSVLHIQNQGSQPGGDILLNLSGSLEAFGIPNTTKPSILATSLINETVGAGNSGRIKISAGRVVFQAGAQMSTPTYTTGASGDIIVTASESIQVAGTQVDPSGGPVVSLISPASFGAGKAGNLTLSTKLLQILDGALVSSLTLGTGSGGNVVVNATESIEIIGSSPNFSGSNLSASTFNAGNAGNITVNTARLVLRDGGRVDANTIASGNAGNVTVNASDSVEISGTVRSQNLITPSQVGSAANTPDPALQQFLGLPPIPSGSPGDVTINTPVLPVSDGALVTVQNVGTGNAGNLQIRANSIFLNSGGGITASTASGEGGNLSLRVGSLQLRNNSQINAEAGGTGNGGNVTLNTDTLAVLENSRINANAFQGAGGNIAINTQGIYVAPNSRITASSQLGVAGAVQINNPEASPNAGLVNLPENVSDTSDQIQVGCAAQQGNSFTLTGRGGLPENPTTTLSAPTVWRDLQDFASGNLSNQGNRSSAAIPASSSLPASSSISPRDRIVEATGWIINPSGQVELVAHLPQATPSPSAFRVPQCGDLRN
ncbi:filamentous hemagglutinin N-terminal domain-containing protein [Microseira sp. BLCC-F43]|uniref:two-partner secretion domain-containing protein n=1 Tax=Microseira sp. BLCC-F43 TaxID=3153602 RepID=UPI0035B77DBA